MLRCCNRCALTRTYVCRPVTQTNMQRTVTYSDELLSRRFKFDIVRSVRCLPSLPAGEQHSVALRVVDRLDIVDDDDTGKWDLRAKRRPLAKGSDGDVSDEPLYTGTTTLLSGESAHVHVQWSPDATQRLQATAQVGFRAYALLGPRWP